MRRWPFGLVALTLFLINILRLGTNSALRIWNDPVCAIFFVGYLICCAIALAIKPSAPPVD